MINETSIEQNLIDLLKKQGYRYIHGTQLKRNLDSVVLERVEAYNQILHVSSSDLMARDFLDYKTNN